MRELKIVRLMLRDAKNESEAVSTADKIRIPKPEFSENFGH